MAGRVRRLLERLTRARSRSREMRSRRSRRQVRRGRGVETLDIRRLLSSIASITSSGPITDIQVAARRRVPGPVPGVSRGRPGLSQHHHAARFVHAAGAARRRRPVPPPVRRHRRRPRPHRAQAGVRPVQHRGPAHELRRPAQREPHDLAQRPLRHPRRRQQHRRQLPGRSVPADSGGFLHPRRPVLPRPEHHPQHRLNPPEARRLRRR